MQKEVLLNAEEVFKLIGRQSWEIERLKAKVEELSQALRSAPKKPSTETAEKLVKEKSAVDENRDAIKGRLVMQGKSLSAWARENGYTNGVVGKIVERFAGNERRPRSGSKSLEVIEKLEACVGMKICG